MKTLRTCLLLLSVPFALNVSLGQTTNNHFFDSDALGEERAIKVSLPKNYHKYQNHYPAVFVLDGEYSFEYANGAVQFLSNDFGFVPEMIVVSIPNNNRLKDFPVSLNDARYEAFARFLEIELIPFLKSTYRLNEFYVLYGWSSSSGLCLYTLAEKPMLFRGLILAGSGIGPNDQKFLEEKIGTTLKSTTFLYASTEEGPREKGLNQLEILIDEKELPQLRSKFEVLEGTSHVEALAKGLYEGIDYIFNSYYIPEDTLIKGVQAVRDYYSGLSSHYGYEVIIPEGALYESTGILVDNNQVDEAIPLLKYGMQYYTKSASLNGVLASIYEQQGDRALAINYFQRAISYSDKASSERIKYQNLLDSIKK